VLGRFFKEETSSNFSIKMNDIEVEKILNVMISVN
jgi:hypothetical protein